jgi:hypothetical protein
MKYIKFYAHDVNFPLIYDFMLNMSEYKKYFKEFIKQRKIISTLASCNIDETEINSDLSNPNETVFSKKRLRDDDEDSSPSKRPRLEEGDSSSNGNYESNNEEENSNSVREDSNSVQEDSNEKNSNLEQEDPNLEQDSNLGQEYSNYREENSEENSNEEVGTKIPPFTGSLSTHTFEG